MAVGALILSIPSLAVAELSSSPPSSASSPSLALLSLKHGLSCLSHVSFSELAWVPKLRPCQYTLQRTVQLLFEVDWS